METTFPIFHRVPLWHGGRIQRLAPPRGGEWAPPRAGPRLSASAPVRFGPDARVRYLTCATISNIIFLLFELTPVNCTRVKSVTLYLVDLFVYFQAIRQQLGEFQKYHFLGSILSLTATQWKHKNL